MRKLLLSAVSSIALLAACQTNNAAEVTDRDAIQQEEGGRVLLSNKRDIYERKPMTGKRADYSITKIGYSRQQKRNTTNAANHVAYVNRENLANIITDMEVRLPDVTDAATMVTDDEVFVVYRANTTNPQLVADQVQKTALSVVPRYYHVYVSNDQKLITQMEGLKSGRLNDKEYAQTIDMLVREMKKNPHINNTQDDTMNNLMKK
ncbi:MAG: YhcN/YlaJ family sporulation lipoprotein [Ectobacillus sp.]